MLLYFERWLLEEMAEGVCDTVSQHKPSDRRTSSRQPLHSLDHLEKSARASASSGLWHKFWENCELVKCDTMSTVPLEPSPQQKKIINSKSIFKNPYDIKTQLRKKNANVTNTESFWRSNLIKIGDRNEKTENYKLAAYARSFLFASS